MPTDAHTIKPLTEAEPGFNLQRSRKVVLVVDLVESVRLMQVDELGVITRWQAFLAHVNQAILPANQGRLVKSLGDGLMAQFSEARQAVTAAAAMHEWARQCAPLNATQAFSLRVGVHATDLYIGENDVYGTGVNLTARIAALAGPGETVTTCVVRDGLVDALDGLVSDLGDCYLKHVDAPVRVWRIDAVSPNAAITHHNEQARQLQPTVAVIPFVGRSNEREHFAIGDLIADAVIERLGRNADLNIVSRLSSVAFRAHGTDADTDVTTVRKHLNATYVLRGSYVTVGEGKLLIQAELIDAASTQILKSARLSGELGDLLELESDLGWRLAELVQTQITSLHLRHALERPLPTLTSYCLKLSGITMMHRSSASDFERSRHVLDALVERHQRIAGTRAHLAKWHILRIVRGISPAPADDARRAMDHTRRALDLEPENALALAIEGHALCQLSDDAEAAQRLIDRALSLNPNEPMAWLYKSVWSSMWGRQEAAVEEALQAHRLSPRDPMAHYFDLVLAGAYAFDGDHDKAIEMAKRSLRLDRHQAPALRALLVAQGESGRWDDARSTLQLLVQEVPQLTIASYQAMGGASSNPRQRVVAVMRALGIKES